MADVRRPGRANAGALLAKISKVAWLARLLAFLIKPMPITVYAWPVHVTVQKRKT